MTPIEKVIKLMFTFAEPLVSVSQEDFEELRAYCEQVGLKQNEKGEFRLSTAIGKVRVVAGGRDDLKGLVSVQTSSRTVFFWPRDYEKYEADMAAYRRIHSQAENP